MDNGEIHCDKILTYGSAPGYRDISLTVEINQGLNKQEVTLKLSPKDAIFFMKHIINVNRTAWSNGSPLDALDGEEKPAWITSYRNTSIEVE